MTFIITWYTNCNFLFQNSLTSILLSNFPFTIFPEWPGYITLKLSIIFFLEDSCNFWLICATNSTKKTKKNKKKKEKERKSQHSTLLMDYIQGRSPKRIVLWCTLPHQIICPFHHLENHKILSFRTRTEPELNCFCLGSSFRWRNQCRSRFGIRMGNTEWLARSPCQGLAGSTF